MRQAPQSTSVPPARFRHTIWVEQPPSAEQLARCASIRLLSCSCEGKSPTFAAGTASRTGNVSAPAKFPEHALFRAQFFPHQDLLMPSRQIRLSPLSPTQNAGAAAMSRRELQGSLDRSIEAGASR